MSVHGPIERLRDRSSPAAELLRRAPRSRPMTGAERARSTTRIDRLAALPVAAGVWLWLKGVAIAAGMSLTAVAAVKGYQSLNARPAAVAPPITSAAPPPREAPPPAPPPAIPEATVEEIVPPPQPRPVARPIEPPAPVPSSEPPRATDTLAREAAMLEEARAQLATSPSQALAKLDAHAAEFPRGKLGPERELLAIDALRRLGRTDEARARAQAMLARSKGGLYEERVKQLLASMP